MLGGLSIEYGSFEDYCLAQKFDPNVLKDAGSFMAAIQPLITADVGIMGRIDSANCKAVADWARNREALNLNNSRLASIEPVRFFSRLRELRLSGNRIRDASPLFLLSGVEVLDLSQNLIEDARPLTGLTKLRLLHLRGNRLSTVESVKDILQYSPSLGGNPVCDNRPEQPTLPDRQILEACKEEAEVKLINVQTGKCLTIAGGTSTANKVPALQFDCDSHPSRRWKLVLVSIPKPSGGTVHVVQIKNIQTSKCLTIAGGRTGNDVPALQFDCDGHPLFFWSLLRTGDGYRIQNMQTGRCLTIAGGISTENDVPALQFDCDLHPSRIWKLVRTGRE